MSTGSAGRRRLPSGSTWEVAQSASDALPWLDQLEERDRESLASCSKLTPYRGGGTAFRLGHDPTAFEFVVRGRVRLLRAQPSGEEVMIDIVGKGGLLCGNIVYRGTPYCCGAAFDSDGGALLGFERRGFLAVADRCPAVARLLMRAITCRGTCLCSRLVEVGSGKSRERIAKLLGRLADDVGVELPAGEVWVPVRMSRKDLAQMCCMRMETVIRVMRQLQKDAVVETEQAGFLIRDRDALRNFESGSP